MQDLPGFENDFGFENGLGILPAASPQSTSVPSEPSEIISEVGLILPSSSFEE